MTSHRALPAMRHYPRCRIAVQASKPLADLTNFDTCQCQAIAVEAVPATAPGKPPAR